MACFKWKNRNFIRAAFEDQWSQYMFLTWVTLILEHGEHYIEKKGICLYLGINKVEGVENGINTPRWFFSA